MFCSEKFYRIFHIPAHPGRYMRTDLKPQNLASLQILRPKSVDPRSYQRPRAYNRFSINLTHGDSILG